LFRRLAISLALILPNTGLASNVLDFDTALTLEPQHIEVGGQAAAGDGYWAAGAKARLGLAQGLDAHVVGALIIIDEEFGFEVGFGPRYRLLETSQTGGFVDVATAGDFSVGLAGSILSVSLDPKLMVSRNFRYSKAREFFFGLAGGPAITMVSVSGAENERNIGLYAALTMGLDLTSNVRFALDVALRHQIKRVGGTLMTYF
jgi:hypothetical protein